MFTLEGPVSPNGPLLPVAVSHEGTGLLLFRGIALLDTGASHGHVDRPRLDPHRSLLRVVREKQFFSPGSTTSITAPAYDVIVSLDVPGVGPVSFRPLLYEQAPIREAGHSIVLGREFLAPLRMRVDGPARRFTLEFRGELCRGGSRGS